MKTIEQVMMSDDMK